MPQEKVLVLFFMIVAIVILIFFGIYAITHHSPLWLVIFSAFCGAIIGLAKDILIEK